MTLKTWFRRWIRSFSRLMTVGSHPPKSDKQREKERDRRRKAKQASPYTLKKKRKYKRRHSGNYKVLNALFGFFATSLGIFSVFLSWLKRGGKSAKPREKASRKAGQRKAPTTTSHTTRTSNTNTPTRTAPQSTTTKPIAATPKTTPVSAQTKCAEKREPLVVSSTRTSPVFESATEITPPPPPAPKEIDENTPKSTPKHEKDQYIRKRMIIAGSSYCDASVLAKLKIGTYFDLAREPDNPYDKDAVVLTVEGEKIGYIAKKDVSPFAVSLKLRRSIYGVITDIITENSVTKYEYETWFDNNQ